MVSELQTSWEISAETASGTGIDREEILPAVGLTLLLPLLLDQVGKEYWVLWISGRLKESSVDLSSEMLDKSPEDHRIVGACHLIHMDGNTCLILCLLVILRYASRQYKQECQWEQ
jgi:hypothetical protein